MSKNNILMVSIILLVVGVIGLVTSFSTFLMWSLVIIGVIGLIWGYSYKSVKVTINK